jgi:cell division septation protein DedD
MAPPSGASAAAASSAEKAPAEPKAVAPSEPAPEAKPAPAVESKSDAKPDAAKSTGAYVVQVAAFSDRFGARSLVAKLKKSGFPGYTETVTTDKGTLHRVRVGPYASHEVADAARAKLKAAGFAGVVARSG